MVQRLKGKKVWKKCRNKISGSFGIWMLEIYQNTKQAGNARNQGILWIVTDSTEERHEKKTNSV